MRNQRLRDHLFAALWLLASAPLAGCSSAPTSEVLTSGIPSHAPAAVEGPMAVGPGGIFLVEGEGGTGSTTPLARIPLAGGSPSTLDPSAVISSLALDQDSVFYSEFNFDLPGPPVWSFTINRVSQAGGASQTLVSGPNDSLVGLAVGGRSLVYATLGMASTIVSPTKQGTGAVFVQPIAPLGQPPAAPVPLAQDLAQPCALAADSARVYWLDCTTQQLLSVPFSAHAGDAPTVLASSLKVDLNAWPSGPQLAVAAGHLYWFEDTAVRTMPVGGGAPSTFASQPGWAPAQLMADEKAVYWMTALNWQTVAGDTSGDWEPGLWTANAGGGPATQVLGADASPGAVAMDASFVYWIDSSDASLRRQPR